MDIQFYGANCISVSSKQARLLIDDNLADLGGKSVAKEGDIALFTTAHAAPSKQPKIVIDRPGEYEVSEVSIFGIAARAHIDEKNQKTASMYKLVCEDIRMLITGHIYPELSEAQLENIGTVDVMFVPVGGNGYTLDPVGALQLIKKVEPKLVISTHYADSSLNYPVPQTSLQDALKGLAMEPKDTVTKLRLKLTDLSDTTQLVVFEKS